MNSLDFYLKIFKSRFFTNTPLVLTHLVTSLCNCRCKTCNAWKKSPEYKDDLSKEEIFNMLEDAKEAGIICYTAWGGEPLLRKELPEILKFAKTQNLVTTVVTNGLILKERYKEITPFLDFLVVSIDSNDDTHDKMRGVKGVRERAIEGIKLSKKSKTKIIINSVISNRNLDKIDGLLRLSKKLEVPIVFEPMEKIEGYNEKYLPSKKELKKAFSKIIKFKKSGHRVGNSLEYLNLFFKKKTYICHAPKILTTIDTKGNVILCPYNSYKKIGNIKDKKLKDIFKTNEFKDFCKKVEKCNRCDVSCVIETSLAYSLNPLFLLDKVRFL